MGQGLSFAMEEPVEPENIDKRMLSSKFRFFKFKPDAYDA